MRCDVVTIMCCQADVYHLGGKRCITGEGVCHLGGKRCCAVKEVYHLGGKLRVNAASLSKENDSSIILSCETMHAVVRDYCLLFSTPPHIRELSRDRHRTYMKWNVDARSRERERV